MHATSATFVIAAGIAGEFGWIYWCGAAFFALMLVFQHRLVKPHDLSKVNAAFFTTNGIASVIFALFVVTAILLGH